MACTAPPGIHPFVASTWAHVAWGPWRLPHAPLVLQHSLATMIATCMLHWSPPFFILFDGAQDRGQWHFGVWSLGTGADMAFCKSLGNQQVVELGACKFC